MMLHWLVMLLAIVWLVATLDRHGGGTFGPGARDDRAVALPRQRYTRGESDDATTEACSTNCGGHLAHPERACAPLSSLREVPRAPRPPGYTEGPPQPFFRPDRPFWSEV